MDFVNNDILAGAVGAHADGDAPHLVQFYEGEAFFVETMVNFVGAGLGGGQTTIVIATQPHLQQLEVQLRSRGLDVSVARETRRYVTLDAVETLSRLIVSGRPDESRFAEGIGTTISAAAAGASRVRAFDELVTLLWGQGQREAAFQLEELWNDLCRRVPFALLCAYPLASFASEADATWLQRTCALHSHVSPAESYSSLANADERLRQVAQLQQRSRALEPEITGRRKAEEARDCLAAIIEHSDDAIIGKTLEGIVTSWNRGAERIFGYTAAEMIGQPISRLAPVDRLNDLSTILSAIRRGERVDHFETERLRKDGSRIDISLTVSPIRDASGKIVGASKIARDVTERKRAERERTTLLRVAEEARAEAEAANLAKDQFLAMLGHELRNPLSTVRNGILAARLDPTRRDHALEIARRGAENLGRLVDDLLDVARIKQGRIVLRREAVSFISIVEHAIETGRPLIEERGHTLVLTMTGMGSDLGVHGDALRLEQVIGNLLANAAKYTNPGGRIEVGCSRESGEVVLRVRDSGIGISPTMLPRVFDLFTQAAEALDRSQGGLGIGLTLVKRLVNLHGDRSKPTATDSGKERSS